MRLLLFFLLCYFTYRYGKFLYNMFQAKKEAGQPKQTIYTNDSRSQPNNAPPNKSTNGEYVDFEEIKE